MPDVSVSPALGSEGAVAYDDRLRRRAILIYAVAVACTALLNNLPGSLLHVHRLGLNLVILPALLALVAIWRFPWGRYHRNAFLGITFTSLALVATAVRFSGGWGSVFAVFYFLIVIFNVSYYRQRLAFALAMLIALCSLSPVLYDPDPARFTEHLIVFAPTILLMGAVADALNREVQARVRQTVSLLTHQQDAERETVRLKALQRAGVVVSAQLDVRAAMRAAVDELATALGYAYVGAYLQEGEWLTLQAYAGASAPPERWRVGEGVLGRVAQMGRAVLVPDAATDPAYVPTMRGISCAACVPIAQHEVRIGVLNVEHSAPLERRDLELLELFSQQIAAAVSNAQLHAVVAYAARTDSLTGLLTHGTLLAELRDALRRAHGAACPLAVLFFDLDDFKLLNDTFGHQFGDGVLRTLAMTLRGMLREGDIAGRYGGEEFMVVLPGADDAAARAFAEAARERVEAHPFASPGGETVRVTMSGGYALSPDVGSGMDVLIRAADLALYEAKQAGKNRVCSAAPVFATP